MPAESSNQAAVATVAAGATNKSNNATGAPTAAEEEPPRLVKELRRKRIHAAMRDQTLCREEKQKQLHEIKAKVGLRDTPGPEGDAAEHPVKDPHGSQVVAQDSQLHTTHQINHAHGQRG